MKEKGEGQENQEDSHFNYLDFFYIKNKKKKKRGGVLDFLVI